MQTSIAAALLLGGVALGASGFPWSGFVAADAPAPQFSVVPARDASTRVGPVTQVTIDPARGEVLLPAVLRHPSGSPGVDSWGTRSQAFLGCARAAGRPAEFLDWFIFVVDASTQAVQDALVRVGAKSKVHYSYVQAEDHKGFDEETTDADYLQGDPMLITIRWREGGEWRELPYEDFFQEKVRTPSGAWVVKPWTPHFVFHGSGAIYATKAGCLACPGDCAGGLIANNQMPIYTALPILRFDWSKAPPEGTRIEVRLRPAVAR